MPSNDYAASLFTTRPRKEEKERKGVYYGMVNKTEVMQLVFSFPKRKERRVHQGKVEENLLIDFSTH